jgi:hypothetical protein
MDDKLLDRIGALLAKAESTDSEHEAEALVSKAQQLATLHAVDLAVARQRTARRQRRETPVQRKVRIGTRNEQGRRHRVGLFVAVAHANDVRVDAARDSTYVLAFGFASDLDVVEALYASLATQLVAAANAAIRRGEHREDVYWSDAAGAWRSDARVFRTAFSVGFANAVAQRLVAAREAALRAAPAPLAAPAGGSSTAGALVLAGKAAEVDAFYQSASRARGSWRGGGSPVAWSSAGLESGAAAGHAARLSGQPELPGARAELA